MIDEATARSLAEAREYIKRILKNENENIMKNQVCPEGRNLQPLPDPKPVRAHAAVDGGNQSLQLDDFTFFAARAWAYIHELREKPQRTGYAGIVVPPHHADYRITIYRETLEAAALIGSGVVNGRNLAEMAELVLFDGNIRNSIRWWSPGAVRPQGEEEIDLGKGLDHAYNVLWDLYNTGTSVDSISFLQCNGRSDCVEEFIAKAVERPIVPRLVLEMVARDLDGKYFSDTKWITALEVVEKLYLYKEALESSWRNGGYPIFLSKSSTTTQLCKEKHSDIFYLRRIHGRSLEPGYIFWSDSLQCGAYEITRLVRKKAKPLVGEPVCSPSQMPSRGYRFFPEVLGLRHFYVNRLGSIEFYVRLSGTGPFMNANLAFDMARVDFSDLDDARAMLEEALARLASVPMTHGYPLSLVLTHNHARILPEEVIALARGAGLELQMDPRMKLYSHSRW